MPHAAYLQQSTVLPVQTTMWLLFLAHAIDALASGSSPSAAGESGVDTTLHMERRTKTAMGLGLRGPVWQPSVRCRSLHCW